MPSRPSRATLLRTLHDSAARFDAASNAQRRDALRRLSALPLKADATLGAYHDTLLFLAALGQLIAAPWFYAGLGVTTDAPGTAVALVLFFLAMPAFVFPLTPLGSMLSRRHEFEADRYAAQHASGEALVHALVKLYEDNAATLTPDPLHSLFYDSHPPAAIRIAHLKAVAA